MNILIYGDSMLDVSIVGSVKRISPEAPVPILVQEECFHTLGGAANVAQCLKALGANVTLVTVIGKDENGEKLKELSSQIGIRLLSPNNIDIKTTTKTRFWASNQQLFRYDNEEKSTSANRASVNLKGLANPCEFDLIIFSDYEKGSISADLISEVVSETKGAKQVICDPKGVDCTKYAGVFSITPNFVEALLLCNMPKEAQPVCRESLKRMLEYFRSFEIQQPIITLAENGLAYLQDSELVIQETIQAQLADPTGAGDAALAALAYGIAQGHKIDIAAKYACAASSYTVTHVGTSPCPLEEMIKRLEIL